MGRVKISFFPISPQRSILSYHIGPLTPSFFCFLIRLLASQSIDALVHGLGWWRRAVPGGGSGALKGWVDIGVRGFGISRAVFFGHGRKLNGNREGEQEDLSLNCCGKSSERCQTISTSIKTRDWVSR